MTCSECESHRRLVEQAEGALTVGMKSFKRLDLMTYSEVADAERRMDPLKDELRKAKSGQRAHMRKCGASP